MRANVFVFILILFLSGCGGGSSGDNGPDPFNPDTNPVIGLSVVLLDANCNVTTENTFANDGSICVQATLTSDGTASSSEVVNFSLDNAVGTLSASTALTNASGVAQVTITGIANTTGAATLSATFATNTASQSFEFTAGAPDATTNLAISLLDNNCNAVSLSSFRTDQELCIRALLTTDGIPQTGEVINFTVDTSAAALSGSSALTNDDGIAEVRLNNVNDTIGAGAVTATFNTETASINFEYSSVPPPQVQTLVISVLDSNCQSVVEPVFTTDDDICVRALLSTNNEPLVGEVVNFTINSSIGSLNNTTALTNTNGIAEVIISNDTGATGATSVSATFGQLSSSGNFEYFSVPPAETQTLVISVLDSNCQSVVEPVFTTDDDICVRALLSSNSGPLAGEIINFAINSSIGSLNNTTALTNTDGIAEVTISNDSGATGATSISATFGQLGSTGNFEYTPSPTGGSGPVIVIEMIADGQATNSFNAAENVAIRATFVDTNNSPIAGEIITFSVNNANISISPSTALTNTLGTANATLIAADTVEGAFVFNAVATLNGANVSTSLNFEVSAAVAPPSSNQLNLALLDVDCTTSRQSFATNDIVCLQATLTTDSNVPVSNQIVDFSLAGNLGTLSAPNALTNSNGIAQVTISNSTEATGASSVSASFSNLNATQNYEYVQNTPSQQLLSLLVLDSNCNAISQPSFTTTENICVRTQLTVDGIAQSGELINFSLSNNIGILNASSALTDELGFAEIFISNNNGVIGASTVTATFATSASTGNFEYASIPQEQIQTLAITILDANCETVTEPVFGSNSNICVQATLSTEGEPLTGQIISFAINSSIGQLDNATSLTNSEGIAQVEISNSAGATGATSITASINDLASSANFEYTADTTTANNPIIVVELIAAGAGASNEFQAGENIIVRATLLDESRVAIEGEIITFSVNNSNISISPSTALTGVTGTGSTTLLAANTVEGAFVLNATATLNGSPISTDVNFQVLPAQTAEEDNQLSLAIFTENCSTAQQSFEASETICAQATLQTLDGTPVANQIVNFTLANQIGSLSTSTALTDINGVAESRITNTNGTLGASTISASFETLTTNRNFAFVETSVPETTLRLSVLNSNCTLIIENSFITTETLCVRATLTTDGEAQVGEVINFSLNNNVALLSNSNGLTDANGVAEINIISNNNAIGAATLTATFGTLTATDSFEYSEIPVTQVQTLSIAVLNENCISRIEPVFTTNENICVQATLVTDGAVDTGEIINFAINSNIGTLNSSTGLTDTRGVAEVQISNANATIGATSITATFGALSDTANYEYTSETPGGGSANITLELIANGITTTNIEAAQNVAIRATFLDETNTAVEGEILTFSTNSTGIAISPITALTSNTGTANSTLLAADSAVGAFVLTATGTVNSQNVSSTLNFQVSEQAPTSATNQLSFAVLNSSCAAADQSFGTNETICLQATLLDSNNAPVANEIINFSQSSALGSLSATSALTNSQGIAQITVSNSSATVGAATLTATYETLTQSLNYEYVAASDNTSAAPTITVALFFNAGQVNSFIAGTTPVVRATVLDAQGAAVENAIVTYALQGTGPVLTPTTALTGNTGIAETSLTATDSDLGAYAILASATVNDVNISNSVNFAVTNSGAASGTTIRVGHFNSSNTFVENIIGTTVADENSQATISAGATVGFEVALIDQDGNRVTTPTPISFTSTCVSDGQATIDATVNTINGVASATFEDTSCAGASGNSDQIVASVVINNSTTTLVRNLDIQAESIGSISFVSASPDSIVLTGTGGQNNSSVSTLTFQVNGELGNPLSQQNVSFALNSTAGGLTLDPSSGLTNSNGQVSTRVTAGTIPTPVRVTASVSVNSSTTIQTQSDLLTVNTGLPDQNSFNIAASILNPEAFNISGQTVTITARLADAFNNPVPNGTTVNFTTESGSVEPTCQTGADANGVIDPTAQDTGTCSVTWTSQTPLTSDHRSTILAYAIGHETLFDSNGNNAYEIADGAPIDDGTDNGSSITGFGTTGFVDHSEAWIDFDEDGVYDSFEPFFDFNGDNTFSGADENFNGPQCNFTTGDAVNRCDGASSIHIRRSLVMITSSSAALWRVYVDDISSTANIIATNDSNVTITNANVTGTRYSLPDSTTSPFILVYYDTAEQILASGTQLGTLDSDGNISILLDTVNNSSQGDSTAVPGSVHTLTTVTNSSGAADANITNTFSFAIDSPSGTRTNVDFSVINL